VFSCRPSSMLVRWPRASRGQEPGRRRPRT
jgi:hypothetical protein